MSAAIDISGEQYGRLTVIGAGESRDGRWFWLCRCICGNEVTVSGSKLRFGHTQSCGCSRRTQMARLPKPVREPKPGEGHGVTAYNHYKCRCGVCRAAKARHRRKYAATVRGREAVNRGSQKHRGKIRDFIRAAKDMPCADCGVQYHPEAMDFDHRPGEGKTFNIGTTAQTRTIAMLAEEIKKCDVVCATCHRLRAVSRRELR